MEFTFAVGKGNYPDHIAKALSDRGNWRQIAEDQACEVADFYWRQITFGTSNYHLMDKRRIPIKPLLIFNHFEAVHTICTKTLLIKNLKTYYEQNRETGPYSVFDSTPTTFLISQSHDEREVYAFLQRFKEIASGVWTRQEKMPQKHCQENMWLVKPANEN